MFRMRGKPYRSTLNAFQLIEYPPHYTSGSIEVWDFIADQGLDFFSGNIVKYICRAGRKEGTSELEDLKKARAYIGKKILETEKKLSTAKDCSAAKAEKGDCAHD